jgi:hypothetical protein
MGKHIRVLVGSVAATVVAAVIAAAAGAGGGPTFHAPVTLPGSQDGNEPSLAISPNGVRYASWQGPGEFARSKDGVHFANLGEPDPGAIGDVTNAVDAAGAVYNAQICGAPTALHTCVYRSLDGGHTWEQTSMLADSHPGASDRPWIDVYPHIHTGAWNSDQTTVYLEYHTFSPDVLVYVTVSHDGGHTFSAPVPVETGIGTLDSGCNTVPSGIVVDDATGNVYAAWLSGDDLGSNAVSGCNYSQLGPFNKAWVSTSTDQGASWSAQLAWRGFFDTITKIGDNADKIFGTISVDKGGQVHVLLPVRRHDDPNAYAADCETNSDCKEAQQKTDLVLVSSPDHGAHWTKPFTVRSGGSNFFPWIAAGSTGILDAVYYTSSTLRPNDPGSIWYIGFSQVTGAAAKLESGRAFYPATPKVTSTLLDTNVVHRGGICTFGIFCSVVPNANRDLADSIAIAIDKKGGANAVWTNDASGTSRVDFACQQGGPSAYAGKTIDGCYVVK